ncbi:MAG TPA: ATP-binding cassette domain-containing protein [Candidatus Binataceae bacterium]|nr:ATP-binding cassette domain-containing protein [Candidatus Binataceae bacterium]
MPSPEWKVPAIKLEHICKRFGDNVALDDVSIDLAPGEITALLGENGAGKSTLMKVLYGYYSADSGRVLLDDAEVRIRSPRDAREHGIFMVMQSPSLVPELPLFENLMMFDPRMRGASTLLTPRSVRDLPEATVELANQLVPGVDFKKRVFEFDLPTIQLLEVVKVVMCEPRVLILDEPSAILGDHEMRRLYDYLAMQRAKGVLVVLITHKIRDVRECADRVLVMRKARLAAERRANSADRELLADMMAVNGNGNGAVSDRPPPSEDEAFSATGLAGSGWRDFSISIKHGELVGIAGISGSGQTELAAMLSGFAPAAAGTIKVSGERVSGSLRNGIFPGIGYIPHAPRDNAIAAALSMAENLLVRHLRELPPVLKLSSTHRRVPERLRNRVIDLKVHPPQLDLPAGGLSGGNLQKLVVARELGHDASAVIAVYPTMGLDPATQELVHNDLRAAAAAGKGVLLIHEDLEVLREYCDRILVVADRRVAGTFERSNANAHEMLNLMTGGKHAA